MDLELFNDISECIELPVPVYEPNVKHGRRQPSQENGNDEEDRVDPGMRQPGRANDNGEEELIKPDAPQAQAEEVIT